VHFEYQTVEFGEKRFAILLVNAAHTSPVRFKEAAYVRVGSYKKPLRDFPEHERRLWAAFNQVSFEENVAASDVDEFEVLDLIDYPSYYQLLKRRLPGSPQLVLEGMASDGIVRSSQDSPNWDITNLGALLFASDISNFPALSRKALRIIQYEGTRRVKTIREQVGVRGYASGFLGAARYLDELLPSKEVITGGIREDVRVYPPLAMRELLANALIHQDFTQTGNGPMVEVFDGRIEVTSPGQPLIDPARFIDAPPRSRNEKLGSIMRRAGICEERGSGWDKIGFEIEMYQLPAPKVEVTGGSTRVTTYGPKPFSEMDKTERIRAVYLHACLKYVDNKVLTNASLRERFGLDNTSQVSRLISDAVEAGMIAPFDPSAGRKYMRYVPSWAVGDDWTPA
jgi:predicted HTH transcriptional regulator